MSLDVPLGARFLSAFVVVFILTVLLLGGAGYFVTQVAVPPVREMFRTSAFEFELAAGWWCELDRSAYVCTPAGKPPHAAMIVIAVKERNTHDTLAGYEEHLKQPQRANAGSKANAGLSEVRFVRRRALGAREWVEALHTGSEIPDYNTYYLAATTSYVGILVTMSVHKDYADRYIAELIDMMSSLSVYQR
jgi:hypothetical protein